MEILKGKRILFVVTLLYCFICLSACGSKDSGETSIDQTINQTETINQIDSLQLQLEKVTAPEEVTKCLNEVGPMTIAHNLRNLESDPSFETLLSDIQIMEPFVIYTLQQDGTYNHNNIYYFPVVSGQKVLFTVDVFLSDTGEYQCGSTLNGERFTQFIGTGVCNRVYVDGGTESQAGEYNIIPVESDTRNIQTDVELTKQNINVLMNVSDMVQTEYKKIQENQE